MIKRGTKKSNPMAPTIWKRIKILASSTKPRVSRTKLTVHNMTPLIKNLTICINLYRIFNGVFNDTFPPFMIRSIIYILLYTKNIDMRRLSTLKKQPTS